MRENTVKAVSVAGSVLLLGSMGVGVTNAFAQPVATVDEASALEANIQEARLRENPMPDTVIGRFSFTQGEIDSVGYIAQAMKNAPQYLCGTSPIGSVREAGATSDALSWEIAISGAVQQGFTATVRELAEEKAVHQAMGCACGGNRADGAANVNADVEGIPLQTILEEVRPLDGANTIMFTSADGYSVALPLSYMKQHHSIIAYNVNGEPLENSMGGANQLWVGSTAGMYFIRDIVEITLESRDVAPDIPGLSRDGNLPNVSIRSGAQL